MIFLSFNSESRLLDWIWCYLYCDWRQFRSIFSVMACLFPRECWESIPIMNIKRNFHVLSLMWVPWFSLIRVNLFWGSTLEFKIIAAITVNLLFESQVCCQNHLGLPSCSFWFLRIVICCHNLKVLSNWFLKNAFGWFCRC